MAVNGHDDLFDPRQLKGDGKTEMVIFDSGGKVIQRFREAVLHVAYDPANAVEIGKKLIDCAVDCGAQVQIKVPKRQITETQRKRLITRATHVFRSLQEKGRPPKHIAQQVVDVILSGIE